MVVFFCSTLKIYTFYLIFPLMDSMIGAFYEFIPLELQITSNALAVDSANGKTGEKGRISPYCGNETTLCYEEPSVQSWNRQEDICIKALHVHHGWVDISAIFHGRGLYFRQLS